MSDLDSPFRLGVLVAGVQKAGTTSLFSYLGEHPGLLVPADGRKELHWFDDEKVNWDMPDEARLRRAFPASPGWRIPVEATPITLFWPPALERARAHNPGMRLIFIFRDPVERAWSHWRMEWRRGREELPFNLAIRQGRWRLRGIDPLAPQWRIFSYVERGFYGRQLRWALEIFPRDQMLFLRASDLAGDHQSVLLRIADFLGLEPFGRIPARQEHQTEEDGATLPDEDAAYLADLYRDDLADFATLSELDVSGWLTMGSR